MRITATVTGINMYLYNSKGTNPPELEKWSTINFRFEPDPERKINTLFSEFSISGKEADMKFELGQLVTFTIAPA